MFYLKTITIALATAIPLFLAQTCGTITPAQAPVFASGYTGRVVMNGLRTPRGIIFDNQGNLLTTEQGGYGVRYIQLTDNGGTDVCVKTSKQLISDATINHGAITSNFTTVRPSSETNHSYPECHSVWDPTVLPAPLNATSAIGSPIANGTDPLSTCTARVPPKLCFPAHTAPLDIKFNAVGTAAYIAFHGSWDKSPPDGFRLSRVSWDAASGMPVAAATSANAAVDVLWNRDNRMGVFGRRRWRGMARGGCG